MQCSRYNRFQRCAGCHGAIYIQGDPNAGEIPRYKPNYMTMQAMRGWEAMPLPPLSNLSAVLEFEQINIVARRLPHQDRGE